jgi:2-oxoglutarate dehydrogenase E1 component
VGRDASAAPAAGYMALHVAQQEKFINQALAADKSASE